MARHEVVTVPGGHVWTELTDGEDVGGPVLFQNSGGYPVEVWTTTSAAAPALTVPGVTYMPGKGEKAAALADVFNMAGATRLWARAPSPTAVLVSYT